MKQCKNIAELEYKAYLEELRSGKKVGQAIEDAYKKGAPRVYMEYEVLRRQIAHRYNHGDYENAHGKEHRHFLDVMYEWWLNNKQEGNRPYQCLLERIEQPAPWPVGLHTFRRHVYRYARGGYKTSPTYFA